jgi:hypothetical protein
VFPTLATLQAAVQLGVLTRRQGQVLEPYVEAQGARVSRRELSGASRRSGAVVRREFEAVVRALWPRPDSRPRLQIRSTIKRVRVRGERKARVYRRRQVLFNGRVIDSWLERIGDEAAIGAGWHGGERVRKGVPIRSSRMRRLLQALVDARPAVGTGGIRPRQPRWMTRHDWQHNLLWAGRRQRRFLRRARVSGSSHPELSALVLGLPVCGACHTPVLIGARLGGRLITRRRQFCDASCKMKAVREAQRARSRAARGHPSAPDPAAGS